MTIGSISEIRTGTDIPAGQILTQPFSFTGPVYLTTSLTSVAIAAGYTNRTFELEDEKLSYAVGTRVRATSVGTGQWMEGVVHSYDGSLLTVTMDRAYGSGSHTDWSINVAGVVSSELVGAGSPLDAMINLSFNSGAMTISLKTLSLNQDPTAQNSIQFLSPRGELIEVNTPLSLVVPSGATLGTTSGHTHKVWFLLIDEPGFAPRLGVFQARDSLANIVRLPPAHNASTTLISAGADSIGVIYSDKAISYCNYIVLGSIADGWSTAGTWTAGGGEFTLYAPGSPLPGDIIQSKSIYPTAVAQTSGTIPFDDTVPQITEGTQVMSLGITPREASSVIEVEAQAYGNCATGFTIIGALFLTGQSDALAASMYHTPQGRVNSSVETYLNSIIEKTFTFRMCGHTAGHDVAFNGSFSGPTRYFGGTFSSYMIINERMS